MTTFMNLKDGCIAEEKKNRSLDVIREGQHFKTYKQENAQTFATSWATGCSGGLPYIEILFVVSKYINTFKV